MATTTDAKIQEAVMPLRNEVADLKKALTTSMLPEVDRDALKRELRDEILKELQVGPPPGLDSQSSSDLSSAADPSEMTWVLGSLGRNLDQQEAMERARQALATAGCEQPDDMFAPYGLGSQVHLRFLTAAKAGRTRMLLRQKPTRYDGESSHVWLDLKKSRAERLPKMLLKELEKGILEIKNAMSHDWSVIRCGSTKKVYVNKAEVVKIERNNTLTWQDESPILLENRKELTARIAAIASR